METTGEAATVVARVGRTLANALTVDLKDGAGAELGSARQKNSAGVLFGFKNGGRSRYVLTSGGAEYVLDVGDETAISKDGTSIGRIVPHEKGARIDDAAGTARAFLQPHDGPRSDDPWNHRIVDTRGAEVGTLSLMRSHTTMNDVVLELALWDKAGPLKAPSAGVRLVLAAPLAGPLGDLLLAACVDACVLPRGYVSV